MATLRINQRSKISRRIFSDLSLSSIQRILPILLVESMWKDCDGAPSLEDSTSIVVIYGNRKP